MAVSEGKDDENNDLIRYTYGNFNSTFLKTVVTPTNHNKIATDIRNAKWAPDYEKLMEQVEPGCSFLFYMDYKFIVDLLYD